VQEERSAIGVIEVDHLLAEVAAGLAISYERAASTHSISQQRSCPPEATCFSRRGIAVFMEPRRPRA